MQKKKQFLQAVDTLRLYRRAELVDEEGHKLIKDLYIDPLPDDHVLNTLLRPNTTFLIGRKGTGKSTIMQRAQEELNADRNSTWAYIDIKTLFESSTSEIVGNIPDDYKGSLEVKDIRKISIFRHFLIDLINEIKKQITMRIQASVWSKFRENFTGSTAELFERLDELISKLESYQFSDVTGSMSTVSEDGTINKASNKGGGKFEIKVGKNPEIGLDTFEDFIHENESNNLRRYNRVFVRIFNIRQLIGDLVSILKQLKLRRVFIFIDDFSELPKEDMEEIVDTILSPFNNWSDEFIKLKIAIYPGRLYPGEIDLSKVDEVYLDIYRAYGQNDVTGMEEKAIDFTKRLVTTRVSYFCKQNLDVYFDSISDEFWRTLFYSCMGNPRILGYILYYCYENSIIYDRKISIRTIHDASRKYYEEKIYHYFRLNKFLHESFEERSSIFSLKELLEQIVNRAKELRNYRDSKVMKEIEGRPPSSHFHVYRGYDSVLSSLELNFFLTKYYEMKDRDGKEVSVYALNFGLCQQETISFGRPRGKREHRLYFVERVFDFTPIIVSYIKLNQELVCDNCFQKHGYDLLDAIKSFDMLCPSCKKGQCKVVNLSRKYENLVRSVSDENLLPSTELGILATLHDQRAQMFAQQIALELDCSYQLIGKRGKKLADRNLVVRAENESGRRVFEISDEAEKVYFTEEPEDQMEFSSSVET